MMGIFLLFVTLVLEALGGVWSYYFGAHYTAGMAGMLNATFEAWYGTSRSHFHVTTALIGRLWVVGYVLIHLGAVVGYVKGVTKKRLKMGSPGPREIEAVDRIYRQLATASPPPGFERVSHLRWPGAFHYAPGHGVTLSFLGFRLIIDEGLFTSRYLKPLLAQQLFAWNSGDVWLRVVFACLAPLAVYVMPLCAICGLPLGIGPFLIIPWWKKYWRDRVYAGDRFAVRLGQGPDLIEALDQVVRPRERPENLFVRESPYAGERIGRIERMMPAGYSRAYAKAGSTPSEEASWTSGSHRFEQAQWGYAQSETPTSSRPSAASEKTDPSSGPSPQAGQSSYTKKADEPASAPGGRYAEWLRQQAASNAAETTGNRSTSSGRSNEGWANVPDWKDTGGYASSNAHPSGPKGPQGRSAGEKKPPRRKFPPWSLAFTPSVTLILEYADAGWHLRWSTPDTDVFFSVLEEFKARFEYDEYYWDPFAFEKGGWWVAFGALSKVSDLFSNYEAARAAREEEYRKQYEEQVRHNRERAAREQQEQQTRQQQEQRSGQRQETSSGQRAGKGSQTQQQPPKREEIKLPRTSQEAYAILSLVPPVTLAQVKRAYRAKARECHPDHGGSHAQMVVINAAFELIQKVVAWRKEA